MQTHQEQHHHMWLLSWWQLLSFFSFFLQVTEELEVFDNCPSLLVYSHPAGSHKTLHKVTLMFQVATINRWRPSPVTFRSWHFLLLFTAPNLVRKSSMSSAWQTSRNWFQWSMCPYQIVSNSKYAPLKHIKTRQRSRQKTKYVGVCKLMNINPKPYRRFGDFTLWVLYFSEEKVFMINSNTWIRIHVICLHIRVVLGWG